MMNEILCLILGMIFMDWIILRIGSIAKFIAENKVKVEHDSIFNEVFDMVGTKNIKFLNRHNEIVTFRAKSSIGKLDILYFLDRNDLAIFQNGICIYTTIYVDRKKITKICNKLDDTYDKKIKDFVIVSNNIIDRRTVERMYLGNKHMPYTETQNKNLIVKKDLNLDDILDKINKVGFENLTAEEKDFLKNHK